MSVFIIQQPSISLLSAGNDNIYTVSGDTLGTANVFEYRYIADVLINGVIQCTLKSFPDPEFGVGVFNIRNIVSSFISFDAFFNDTLPLFNNCPNSAATVQIQFGDEYVSGNTFVQNRNDANSDQVTVINGSLSFPDQQGHLLENYTQDLFPLGSQFAFTKLPAKLDGPTFLAYSNTKQLIYFLSNVNAPEQTTLKMNVVTYSSTDLDPSHLLGNYVYESDIDNTQGTPVMCAQVGVGALFGMDASNTTAFTGTFPVIQDNVAAYVIAINTFAKVSGGTNANIQDITGLISVDCGRTAVDAYSIMWLNEFGGFDTWLFNKKNETTQTKTVQSYKKVQGQLNSDGTYSLSSVSASQQPYFTQLQDSIVMNTDLLTDKDVLFLKTLVSSPVVFMTDSSGFITAITVQENSYVIKKRVNQKIYSLQMTVNQSYNDYRQIL